ncbi:MAG: glycosyltransferase family 39 protein [Nitrospirota bacterium]|nr:glycosyltransferase family 39 protein [Nitrospirota bacterium]
MLDGQPYLNKPPLYFWLVSVSFKVFGTNFYATKIPSLFFAVISVFFLYWIVYRWFKDRDIAFFTAFSFETTRWIVRNFTTNRPESLLVFSILLGCYALILINEKDRKGPYLFGISFAIGFMTKLFFALFLPAIVLMYGLTTKKIYDWLKWSHVYFGALLGIILSSIWFIYFETKHPGYMKYLFNQQTLQRFTGGLDVNKDPLMYLKEMIKYYHPWLIFFIIGIPVLLKKLKEEYYWFVFLAILIMFVPLQLSKGKASRYLIMVTPFLSVIVSIGILRFSKVKNFFKGFAVYTTLPLFIFFWLTPVRVNPEKFHVIHLAERISKGTNVDYTNPLAFLKSGRAVKEGKLQFVEWTPFETELEYRLAYYFYLSDSFEHWSNTRFLKWTEEGKTPILLLTHPSALKELPDETVRWVEIDADRYHVLLTGVRK